MGDWHTWLIDNSTWSDVSVHFDWLAGTIQEMADAIGIVGELSACPEFSVYKLKTRRIAQEIIDELALIHAMDEKLDEYDTEVERFTEKSPDHEWYWFFRDMYPSEYVIFVTWGEAKDGYSIDGHTVFCRTLPDMLIAVSLLKNLSANYIDTCLT